VSIYIHFFNKDDDCKTVFDYNELIKINFKIKLIRINFKNNVSIKVFACHHYLSKLNFLLIY